MVQGLYNCNSSCSEGTGNVEAYLSKLGFDISNIDPKDVTRELARWLIGNPVNAAITQHPYLTEFLTGVPVADIFHIAGFDMVDGVWHSRPEAWQQIGGYNDFYDVVFDYATSMEKAKFEFSSEKRDYIFWAWKGDYLNLGAGAELGIYSNKSGLMGQADVTSPFSAHWLVDTSLAMPMTMSLNYNGEEIANYSEEQWWITSFNPAYQNVKASQLTATYTATFNTQAMYDDFYNKYGDKKSIYWDPRWTFDPKTITGTLKF